MKSNGVAVPILMDHSPSAASTLGWILDIQRDGDRLLELHQFLGASARDIGLRNKVSLGIDPNFIDGKGIHYGEAIVHSAITPVPVVPNQGDFQPVQLSAGETADTPADNETKLQTESELITLSLEQPAGEDADNVTEEDTTTLASTQEPSSLSAIHPSTIHVPANLALDMTLLTEAAAARRDLAIARGGVDPAVANELFTLLLRHAGNLHTLTRAGAEHQPITPPLALAIFDMLSRNRPVPLGELTAIQVLSRLIPGEDPSARTHLQERMIALANGR